MSHIPASGDSLSFCQSIRNRRRRQIILSPPDINQLRNFSEKKHSSFLFADNLIGSVAKDFLVGLIGLIRDANCSVIWALRSSVFWNKELTFIDILKILVLQALQINKDALSDPQNRINAAHFRGAVDEKDWINLLNQALNGISVVYIITDAELLSYIPDFSRSAATDCLEMFLKKITNPIVKIVVPTLAIDHTRVSRWDPSEWEIIQTASRAIRNTKQHRKKVRQAMARRDRM